MIRPRTGDFLYTDEEVQVMLEDIRIFKDHGIRGIVVGILTKDGQVDTIHMKQFVRRGIQIRIIPHLTSELWTKLFPWRVRFSALVLKWKLLHTLASLLPSSI